MELIEDTAEADLTSEEVDDLFFQTMSELDLEEEDLREIEDFETPVKCCFTEHRVGSLSVDFHDEEGMAPPEKENRWVDGFHLLHCLER